MVLTRAQRAQVKATPPESPLKSSVLKVPARRGRVKHSEVEPEHNPPKVARSATKISTTTRATGATRASDLNRSVGRAVTARNAATKASSAKAAPARAATRTVAKTSDAKIATKTTAIKASVAKTATRRGAASAPRITRAIEEPEICKPAAYAQSTKVTQPNSDESASDRNNETVKEEGLAVSTEDQVERNLYQVAPEKNGAPPSDEGDCNLEGGNKESAAPRTFSPTKLPMPVATPIQPASPSKSSLLSSAEGLGSIRKAPTTAALLVSPARSSAPNHSQSQPSNIISEHVELETSVRDFASGLICSPKRQIVDGFVIASPKRLKMAISMPMMRSPQASQEYCSDSPASPTKSSLRSPEKRPGVSPKKVSWHQTPPPTAKMLHQATPPSAPGILSGCVFYLDVNSLDGMKQNTLFMGLVQELGGDYVESWSHNNMGITHVLFMNGEMRTLEKVLASNGDVWCVSLGWLLDCQRENIRIPESQPRYQVDLSHVPGHTPKHQGTSLNTPMTTRPSGPVSHTPAIPPPKWALPNTPAMPREPLGALSSSLFIRTPAFLASKTPVPPPSVGIGVISDHDKENMSPISEATPLVQKTCPPKQCNKSILAMSTGISATPLRNKFLSSRRRRSFSGGPKAEPGTSLPSKGLGSPRRLAMGSPLKRR